MRAKLRDEIESCAPNCARRDVLGYMPRHPTPEERDERVVLPLDPEEALRGLLAVKPGDDSPAETAAGEEPRKR